MMKNSYNLSKVVNSSNVPSARFGFKKPTVAITCNASVGCTFVTTVVACTSSAAAKKSRE